MVGVNVCHAFLRYGDAISAALPGPSRRTVIWLRGLHYRLRGPVRQTGLGTFLASWQESNYFLYGYLE
jgi:hypothetical protein